MHGGPGTELWSDIGVLTRDNAHAAEVFDALTEAGVPVEIVGLSGLLRLPEVAEVVAVLHLLKDVTANASLLTLLTGPRWAIGPRDLKLLGDRARRAGRARGARPVAGIGRRPPGRRSPTASTRPRSRASTTRSTTRASAAVLHRGAGAVRAARRASCGCCARTSASHCSTSSGGSSRPPGSTSSSTRRSAPAAAARRDNLDLFVRAVADFQAVDGDVTLLALLAYLTAEEEESKGLEVVAPSAADSVKLLTVHRAKGLEWACGVPRRGLRRTVPQHPVPDAVDVLARGAARRRCAATRRTCRSSAATTRRRSTHYRADTRAHEAREELRLGYVAVTRAAHRLSVTSFCWSPRPTPFGPSAYQVARPRAAGGVGRDRRPTGSTRRSRATPTPTPPRTPRGPGHPPASAPRRSGGSTRPRWCAPPTRPPRTTASTWSRAARVADWDAEVERLLVEARAERSAEIAVPLPGSLSATALLRLQDDAGRVRPGAGQADAAAAESRRTVRHPVPRLGRGPLQAAASPRP